MRASQSWSFHTVMTSMRILKSTKRLLLSICGLYLFGKLLSFLKWHCIDYVKVVLKMGSPIEPGNLVFRGMQMSEKQHRRQLYTSLGSGSMYNSHPYCFRRIFMSFENKDILILPGYMVDTILIQSNLG